MTRSAFRDTTGSHVRLSAVPKCKADNLSFLARRSSFATWYHSVHILAICPQEIFSEKDVIPLVAFNYFSPYANLLNSFCANTLILYLSAASFANLPALPYPYSKHCLRLRMIQLMRRLVQVHLSRPAIHSSRAPRFFSSACAALPAFHFNKIMSHRTWHYLPPCCKRLDGRYFGVSGTEDPHCVMERFSWPYPSFAFFLVSTLSIMLSHYPPTFQGGPEVSPLWYSNWQLELGRYSYHIIALFILRFESPYLLFF